MKNIYFFFILIALQSFGQRKFNHDFTAINRQIISPNIYSQEEQTNIVGNFDAVSAYANKPIELKYDAIFIGGGYNYKKERNYSNAEFYIGRQGSNNDKWRGSLIIGIYKIDSDPTALTKAGRKFLPRRASYAGGSLSYHQNENNYFGVNLNDLYDTVFSDGDDKTFYKFEAMTPQLFLNVALWSNGFESINLYADGSYNSVEKAKTTVSIEYKGETIKAGVFYSENIGAFIQYNFEHLGIYASQTDKTSIGLIIR